MSEFSESYHIKTDIPDETLRRLVDAGLSGLVFPPASGWLTFVPYGLSEFPFSGAGTQPILGAVDQPVLWYVYAEDHGWQFALLQPGHDPTGFECWWDPEPSSDRSFLNIDALIAVMPRSDRASEVDDILRTMTMEEAVDDPPGPRFAALLGLPSYSWLSESYAQSDPSPFLRSGARVIGTSRSQS